MPRTLNNPPMHHKYHGTCLAVWRLGISLEKSNTKSTANTALLTDVEIAANNGFLSKTPNCVLKPACIARKTPPVNANMDTDS